MTNLIITLLIQNAALINYDMNICTKPHYNKTYVYTNISGIHTVTGSEYNGVAELFFKNDLWTEAYLLSIAGNVIISQLPINDMAKIIGLNIINLAECYTLYSMDCNRVWIRKYINIPQIEFKSVLYYYQF